MPQPELGNVVHRLSDLHDTAAITAAQRDYTDRLLELPNHDFDSWMLLPELLQLSPVLAQNPVRLGIVCRYVQLWYAVLGARGALEQQLRCMPELQRVAAHREALRSYHVLLAAARLLLNHLAPARRDLLLASHRQLHRHQPVRVHCQRLDRQRLLAIAFAQRSGARRARAVCQALATVDTRSLGAVAGGRLSTRSLDAAARGRESDCAACDTSMPIRKDL
mmetsp:Transcript_14367/g.35615  ORF Transcript_14367/g.35615 Transcript_14367/m.35615 type:complete len:221 (-) Transcript_14367:838-1500(-)